MSKVMDSINAFLDFIGSYPVWAKIILVISIVLIISTLVFAPRIKKAKKSDKTDILQIIESSSNAEEFKAKILLSKENLMNYLKEKSSYDYIDFAFNVKINNENIDMVAFYHYKEQSQVPHFIFLVKYYDVKPKSIDYAQLDKDWKSVSNLLRYKEIKTALINTGGFNSPIEYPDPLDGDENIRPKIIYNQVVGMRNLLSQVELGKMQQMNTMTRVNDLYRWVGTYNQIIDGLNFWAGQN